MITATARGARPVFGKEGGGKPFNFTGLPDLRIDEDIMDIRIDTLLNIPIGYLPHQGAVTVRTAGSGKLVTR